jgi:FixJ family two-component response regulator
VIIVDDDASVRRALRTQLSVAGFSVRVFASAEELLTAKFPTANACLLLDVYMPGMTGIALWEHLAAAGRQMPTVLMSGRSDEETRKLARKAKGAPCLFKPFDQSALLRAIRKAMCGQAKSVR